MPTVCEMAKRLQQLQWDVLVQQYAHRYAAAVLSNPLTYRANSTALCAAADVTLG
jgi:hypothetical protein